MDANLVGGFIWFPPVIYDAGFVPPRQIPNSGQIAGDGHLSAVINRPVLIYQASVWPEYGWAFSNQFGRPPMGDWSIVLASRLIMVSVGTSLPPKPPVPPPNAGPSSFPSVSTEVTL